MGCLRGLATGILGFLFFLTLAVFSIAFMLHGTVLSYDFVSAQVDKVPISSIARNIAEDQIGNELPQEAEFLKEVAYNVIEKQEPWIKTQLKDAIDTGYDYFLGKTDTLSITVPLSELKTNLKDSTRQEFNSYLNEQLTGKSDAEISRYLQDIIRQFPQDILPPELYNLPPDERDKYIEQYLRDAAGVAPKAGYPTLDPSYKSVTNQYIDQYINDFINEIPNSYTIDESSINSATMHTFQDIRRGIGEFQKYYTWLIVALVVLAALIFMVNWSIKAPARTLGIELLIIGVIDVVGIILVRTLPMMQWASDIVKVDIPASLSTWIEGLVSDVSMVALPLTIGILVVGVILLVVSFIVPSKEKEALP
jgi:hypothetical protein